MFPNKRSGTFFLKSLSNMLGNRVLLAPEVLSVSDFVENVSGRGVATRIDMLFRLFNIYRGNRSLIPGSVQGDELLEFDAFRSWGEILLSDFSEVDQYNVDPDAIFANVSDYREIASNFLTPDQLEILERYFGYTPNYRDVERFWKNLVPPKGNSSIKERFMYLWQAMAPLYHALDENLAAEGLATPGGVYRVALRRIQEKGESFSNIRKSSSSVLTRCLQPKPLFSRRFRRQGDIMTMKRNHLPISIGMQPDRFWNRPTAMRRRFFALTNAISPLPAGRCHILSATV